MSTAFENARSEYVRLEAEVKVRQDRMKDIETFLRLYKLYEAGKPAAEQRVVLPFQKNTILGAAMEILSDGMRRTTRELLEELSKKGVEVGGEDKVTNLSSVLSRSKLVDNDRTLGWAIIKQESLSP